ncbi:MAG TPA: PhnD/SsuA/transferrin family substrate-binding protein [Stellaceae bacterium]|nr:PhnD/SsuA/transferrin family substrate-binding protein [Stellaceae bacterium]
MPLSAALPMYNLPEMRQANQAFWSALAARLRRAGLDPPDAFEHGAPSVPNIISPDRLFTQICGYPLLKWFVDQATILGTPHYDLPGCEGAFHSAAFLVAEGSSARSLEDLRGSRFGLNNMQSNSGMNLPRLTLAPLAGGGPFFSEVVTTGHHVRSVEMLQQGAVDTCAVDCVTYGFLRRYRPAAVAGTRILTFTKPSPGLVFVTSSATPPDAVAILRTALADLFADPASRPVLEPLCFTGLSSLAAGDYRVVLDYERRAAEAGYPELI